MDLYLVEAETSLLSASHSPKLVDFRALSLGIDSDGFKDVDAKTTKRFGGPLSVYYVRLWCRNREGQSVCVVVANASSTWYRRLRGPEDKSKGVALAADAKYRLEESIRREWGGMSFASEDVDIDCVERHTTNGWHHDAADPRRPKTWAWLRMRCCSPEIKSKMASSIQAAARDGNCLEAVTYISAERGSQVHTQALQERALRPGAWFSVSPSVASRAQPPRSKGVPIYASRILHVALGDLRASDLELMPPLRVLSYDIECYSTDGGFPDAKKPGDMIITIGVHIKSLCTEEEGKKDAREEAYAVSLYETEEIPNGTVLACKTEAEVLLKFAELVQKSDADVLVGYNIVLFDNEYLLQRANLLREQGALSQAQYEAAFAWSRLARVPCIPALCAIGSSAMGDNKVMRAVTPGRIDLDLWFDRKRANQPGLENLKLNTVAQFYLQETKHDLSPREIFAQFREGTPASRATIASYCVQDCVLVTRLVEKLEVLASTQQMAAITGVTASQILWRGQGIKVVTQILEEAHKQNYVVEDMLPESGGGGGLEDGEGATASSSSGGSYEGAIVIEPLPGFYEDPILCLDFASLYPSLMRTFTGCISTYVADPSGCPTEVYKVPNTEHHFVTSNVTRGIIPRILDGLTEARKSAKKLMGAAQDPARRALYNARQLALKISANSVYGFTGCRKGQLVALPVAESTTALGRHVIQLTSRYIEEHYPGSQTVYGDTDSVFMRLPPEMRALEMQGLFELGRNWASEVTKYLAGEFPFRSYVELEFEKALRPVVLWKKKRYAGLCYEEIEHPKLLVKGIELVRKGVLPLVKDIQKEILEVLIYRRDVDAAIALLARALETILSTPLGGPYDAVIQSKSLKSNYKNVEGMPQAIVARLMEAREPGSAPKSGDRVEYIVCASSAARVVDKCESPAHAGAKGLAIDYLYYIGAIEQPLLRLIEIPFNSLRKGAYEDFLVYLEQCKSRARGLIRLNSKCRRGTEWKDGHAAKDGSHQLTLPFVAGQLQYRAVEARPKKRAKTTVAAGALADGRLGHLESYFSQAIRPLPPLLAASSPVASPLLAPAI